MLPFVGADATHWNAYVNDCVREFPAKSATYVESVALELIEIAQE